MIRPLPVLLVLVCALAPAAFAAKKHHRRHTASTTAVAAKAPAPTASSTHRRHSSLHHNAVATPSNRATLREVSFTSTAGRARHRRAAFNPWLSPTFADSTLGDLVDGEDLLVRQAAVKALGPYNGSVVVADPSSGRILSIVNQKLAFQEGFEPCSTIKIVASLAGLSEGVIDPDSEMHIGRRSRIDLTNALAHSNNVYFSTVGDRLGFDRITDYARQFGLGEKAGLNIAGEQVSPLPEAPPSDGLGMMTSFGEGFYFTPLQLAALVSAVANGGTLYYLQYPRSQDDIDQFIPRVKRHLEIEKAIPAVRPGMMGAVAFGTARRAIFDPEQPIFGKTGTCTDNRSPTHLGWFGSFQEIAGRKVVVVVLLTGGHAVNGPVASGVAGAVYRNLRDQGYYAQPAQPSSPAALVYSGAAYGR